MSLVRLIIADCILSTYVVRLVQSGCAKAEELAIGGCLLSRRSKGRFPPPTLDQIMEKKEAYRCIGIDASAKIDLTKPATSHLFILDFHNLYIFGNTRVCSEFSFQFRYRPFSFFFPLLS